MSWHDSLPYKMFQQFYRWFRRTFFSKPRPTGTYVVVDAFVADIEESLGRDSFAPNWEFSYNKKGEDLNLARIEFDRHPDFDVVWWQTHVRGWYHEGELWLMAHWEPEPTEHPKPHLHGDGYDRERGRSNLKSHLDEHGIEYELREYSGDK